MRVLILLAALLTPLAAAAGGISAGRTLPAGTVIGPGDLIADPGANPAEAALLIGMQTRITIYAGRPVNPAQLQSPRLIARNQIAPLVYRRGALNIETNGRALAEGGAGDVIPVMNLASRQTVSAVVDRNGTLLISR